MKNTKFAMRSLRFRIKMWFKDLDDIRVIDTETLIAMVTNDKSLAATS